MLLAAFIAFYPASGAFVSLTQAELMDAWPDRQARHMARWDLAGRRGAGRPLLLTAVLAAGGSWRAGFLALAAAGAHLARRLPAGPPRPAARGGRGGRKNRKSQAMGRTGSGNPAVLGTWETLRWVLLIEVANLLVDVFTGFLALYLVDVVHLSPAVAALAIAIRLAAALAGDAALIAILERVSDLTVLRVSAAGGAPLPGLPAGPRGCAQAGGAGGAERGHGDVVPGAPGSAVRQPARAQFGGGDAEQRAGLAGGLGPLTVGLARRGWA